MKPTNATILDAICALQFFLRLGVPAGCLFVQSYKGGLLTMAVHPSGAKIVIVNGAYPGDPVQEWADATAWLSSISNKEIRSLFDEWMTTRANLPEAAAEMARATAKVLAQHWSHVDPADFK